MRVPAEACAAALGWFAGAVPSEPVVLCTQTANDRSTRLAAKSGFTEVERFEEYGAEQWFGVRSSATRPVELVFADSGMVGRSPRRVRPAWSHSARLASQWGDQQR